MQGNCRFIFSFTAIKIGDRLSGVTQGRLTVGDEEADEMAQRVYKTLLKPAPDDARAQLDDEAGVRRAADMVDAVLRGVAGPAR
jgi:hypothetical protein